MGEKVHFYDKVVKLIVSVRQMNTSDGSEEDGKMEHQRPLGLHHMSLLKTQYLCKQKCVVNSEAHSERPEEMKFHDNSEESINRGALVQAE